MKARGYDTVERKLSFDRDLAIELSLERTVVIGVRPQPAEGPEPAPAATTTEDWMKGPRTKAKRPIDDSNPYGK